MKPIIIAVAGCSASGKTTLVKEMVDAIKSVEVTVISHDDYYKDQSHLPLEERMKTNYDHPDSFDNDLFINHINMLINGQDINKPTYDYCIHNRTDKTELVRPTKVIILEGIMVLQDKRIRDLTDIKIFVKCDEDLAFIRRLKRDMIERGRSVDSIINQYLKSVKPMYNKYIKPTSRYADIIIPNDEGHKVAVEFLNARVKELLND